MAASYGPPADYLLSIVCPANCLDAHSLLLHFPPGDTGETGGFVTLPKDGLLSPTCTGFITGTFCPHPQMSGLMGSVPTVTSSIEATRQRWFHRELM